jgi:ribosomal protein RSM22 (predicted rRNA methylase)
VAARVPATFASNVRVHAALRDVWADFAPSSLLDIGAGPGTASWAAVAAWPSLQRIVQCEREASFADLAQHFNAESGLAVLKHAEMLRCAQRDVPAATKADLVVASYMLAEMPSDAMGDVALQLWAHATQALVLIEPGTPGGFARLRGVRETLLQAGAHVVAPCTHDAACPMRGGDWCHFKTRVQRSRAHMHAKQATVPFEDEAFAYLIMAREPPPAKLREGRIIAPPVVNKVAVNLQLCVNGELQMRAVASRDKANYKRAKKISWGDMWE